MPSTEAPTWWADVQQEREDLAGPGRRPADDWLGEEIDFVPRRRVARRGEESTAAKQDAGSVSGAEHPIHGVFVGAGDADRVVTRRAAAAAAAAAAGTSRTIELGPPEPAVRSAAAADADAAMDAAVVHELRHLRAADDPFATPPPPAGARRTVQIKGRPGAPSVPSLARRRRPRTASDRVGHRPDRIALWAVLLGAVLILLAATTSSSQAAAPHRAVAAAAVTAKVTHVAHHAPVRVIRAHR